MRPERKKCFWKISKEFVAFKTQILCIQHMLRWNHLGNTEETLTLNVFRMFPRLCTQATYLEDAEFVSRKQKCFASFPYAHSCNTVSNIDSKCFCSNVSWFAPALRTIYETSDTQLLDACVTLNTEGRNDVRQKYSKWLWRKNPV